MFSVYNLLALPVCQDSAGRVLPGIVNSSYKMSNIATDLPRGCWQCLDYTRSLAEPWSWKEREHRSRVEYLVGGCEEARGRVGYQPRHCDTRRARDRPLGSAWRSRWVSTRGLRRALAGPAGCSVSGWTWVTVGDSTASFMPSLESGVVENESNSLDNAGFPQTPFSLGPQSVWIVEGSHSLSYFASEYLG